MIPPRRPREEPNVDSWLMTYADMITLLLCFFIIFVAISKPTAEDFTRITDGLTKKFGAPVDLGTPFQGILHSLQAVVETHQALKDVSVEKTETSVQMELSSRVLFAPDSTEFNKDMEATLVDAARVIKAITVIDYRVSVEAYSNDVPVHSAMYASSWELTSAQAARVTRLLIAQGVDPERLRAIGYGPTRPKVPNADVSGHPIIENQARNQRIVIKIERVI